MSHQSVFLRANVGWLFIGIVGSWGGGRSYALMTQWRSCLGSAHATCPKKRSRLPRIKKTGGQPVVSQMRRWLHVWYTDAEDFKWRCARDENHVAASMIDRQQSHSGQWRRLFAWNYRRRCNYEVYNARRQRAKSRCHVDTTPLTRLTSVYFGLRNWSMDISTWRCTRF